MRVYLRHHRHRKRHGTARKHALKRMITARLRMVAQRARFGNWEGDTIAGKEKTERILAYVARKSGFLIAARTRADSNTVRRLTARCMAFVPCKTITYDNGSEFAAFSCIERDTKARVYFAHPGKPHQRGTNENTNGLLRQFFPKGNSFATLTPREVREARSND